MEETIHFDLPNFKATYKVAFFEDVDYGNLENVTQVNSILFNREGKMLIINVIGSWQLPGGHIEKGESYDSALKREIEEETNATISKILPIGYLRVTEIKEGLPKTPFIQLKYFGLIDGIGKRKIDPAHNKIPEIKFIEPKEFTKYIPWGKVGVTLVNKAERLFREIQKIENGENND